MVIVHPDGNRVLLEVFGSPLKDKQGNVIASLVSFSDITGRKQAEEMRLRLEEDLRQGQRMESIGTLAGGIAHDFNNILSSIIGFTELSLDGATKGTPLENNLQEVYTAGMRARDLVKQILAFARQSDEERKPIQVDTIAKEVLKLIRSTIPTTIEIRENIESHSVIMGNPSQVHQLFMNLCTNAAQAMEDDGGTLEVGLTDAEHNDPSPLPQSGFKSGNYLKATVSDTGPGISADIIDSIFEPYFSTKGVGEGTGMGLALVHGIVESYGGKITVDSKLGKGTVFSIYLPIAKISEDHRPYEKEKPPSGTESILFVDDELPIANMGSQLLERLGYRVTVRTSSVEALELFRSKPDDFDLVITDMTMPNMSGDQLGVELMKMRSDIPVILCTGYSNKISEEIAKEIGIKAFAYKPIVKADLAETVRKVLNEAKG
jgi:signal transduction histidine kinase/CheY-like chemotaxis protein